MIVTVPLAEMRNDERWIRPIRAAEFFAGSESGVRARIVGLAASLDFLGSPSWLVGLTTNNVWVAWSAPWASREARAWLDRNDPVMAYSGSVGDVARVEASLQTLVEWHLDSSARRALGLDSSESIADAVVSAVAEAGISPDSLPRSWFDVDSVVEDAASAAHRGSRP